MPTHRPIEPPLSAVVVEMPTPYLMTDLAIIRQRYDELVTAVPGLTVCYAMKCNPSPQILRLLAGRGAGFEVASLGELQALRALGVDPTQVLFSNPIKPPAHIAQAHAAGLWRFAADGPNELAKIAHYAPGTAVYVRLRVDDTDSVVPLSTKFGASPQDAVNLMLMARQLGLRPYGLTFHVGSQCTSPMAWRMAIAAAGTVMFRLQGSGIDVEMLDIGGGIPVRYLDDVPGLDAIAAAINAGLDDLPYRPAHIVAEPGRFLVAEAAVLATTVIGRETRRGRPWLFLDVGAYHGLGEVLPTPGGWRYPIRTERDDESTWTEYCLTGPTCDSTDTVADGVSLPVSLDVGDVLYFGSAGAYTLSYATSFNGFPPPTPLFIESSARDAAR
jgi:ornithine decarboxylase